MLTDFGIAHEVEVVSAHRTPDKLVSYGRDARARGIRVIIAGAGGAAHLPGMLASVTALPVIGVPVPLAYLDGMDSLLSIVQMPAGIPVATVSIGGAKNAGPPRGAHSRNVGCRTRRPRRGVRARPRGAGGGEEPAAQGVAVSVMSPPRAPRPSASVPRSLVEEQPLRYPDASSRAFMTARGWWLVLLNFLLPGSAQVVAGNRRLGRIGVAATLTMWVLAVLGILSALLWRTAFVTLATNWFFLLAVQIVLLAYVVLWVVLTIDTLRLVRLVRTGRGARFGIAGLSVRAARPRERRSGVRVAARRRRPRHARLDLRCERGVRSSFRRLLQHPAPGCRQW